MLSPSDARARLTRGIYVSDDADDATGRIDHALDYVLRTEKLEKRLRSAMKQGHLSTASLNLYEDAKQKDIITDEEYDLLKEAQAAVRNAIKVDEFSNTGWKLETP